CDVRVIEVACCPRLALKTPHDVRRRDELRVDELDGDDLDEHEVRRLVDGAHPTAAQPAVQSILRAEHLADAWILRRCPFADRAVAGTEPDVRAVLGATRRTGTHDGFRTSVRFYALGRAPERRAAFPAIRVS